MLKKNNNKKIKNKTALNISRKAAVRAVYQHARGSCEASALRFKPSMFINTLGMAPFCSLILKYSYMLILQDLNLFRYMTVCRDVTVTTMINIMKEEKFDPGGSSQIIAPVPFTTH